ncbi:MAG: endonuclease/exonuclease/phosphatase family protein [Acidimicrobiia bacterium]|nr:endonuclease/exonuclease/phosphatase family protein [Acidimicrobiia bacterium]
MVKDMPWHSKPDDGASSAGSVLFGTWNIQFGEAVGAAAEVLRNTDILDSLDVLFAQELDDRGATSLAEQIGFRHLYASSGVHARTGRPFGNAILSRHPLTDEQVVRLPGRAVVSGHPRIALQARCAIGGRSWTIASVHTEIPTLPLALRRRQFIELGRSMRAHPSPVLIGGDFNTVTRRGRRALQADMSQAGLRRLATESKPPDTCFRGAAGFALDHFFGRGVTPVASGTLAAQNASDHRLLWLRVSPRP